MTLEIIKELIEKLACDLVLADVEEPETITVLLPVLKKLHGTFMKMSLKEEARQVLKARKLINSIQDKEAGNTQGKIDVLNDLVSQLSLSVNTLKQENPEREQVPDSDQNDSGALETVRANIEKLETHARAFCQNDDDINLLIQNLNDLVELSGQHHFDTISQVARECHNYMGNMGQGDSCSFAPIEEAIVLLKALFNHERLGKVFAYDYSDVMEMLRKKSAGDAGPAQKKPEKSDDEDNRNSAAVTDPDTEQEDSSAVDGEDEGPKPIAEDDIEIINDFIAEAGDNLESIEVNLVELEQDPENKDIINDIFRPFHTIKGVSGFLSLTKINKLAHTTENFLDSARSGDFIINDQATNAILESVDVLKQMIERVEEGVQTGMIPPFADIDIDVLSGRFQALQADLSSGGQAPIGELLVQQGRITSQDLDTALKKQKKSPGKKVGEILVDEDKVKPSQVASALIEQRKSRKPAAAAQVKVSTEKLDDLVDFAGELVIAQSMLRQKTAGDAAVSQSVAQLGLIVSNMQNIAMSMRMIPIKATFMKMIRLVRDLSHKSGKQINLSMEGEETEIDRNVVDALYEPMVHMIRNSCDHGIEDQSTRREKGKPVQGEIVLRAYHKGGHIIIEIEDDGKGLYKEVIHAKAVEKGLIKGSEQMSDSQIFNLIMQPGFSTAKTITDVSGRGVGMDVVKEGIEKFRGHLTIESKKDKGSKFTISLPLTLAIIDGMLVRVNQERYVIPTTAVQKVFNAGKEEYFTVEGKREMIKDRGNLVSLVRLHEIFQNESRKTDVFKSIVVVVESKGEKRALLVDEILGKDEYVIKSLGGNLENIQGLSGGAILSDGNVGLILDIDGIFELVMKG